jgi:hypothetical protein
VADEDVFHAWDAQHVDVLADVGDIQRDPDTGQVEAHQVDGAGEADNRQRSGHDLGDELAFAHDHHGASVKLCHRRQPHVDLVRGVDRSAEVEGNLRSMPG